VTEDWEEYRRRLRRAQVRRRLWVGGLALASLLLTAAALAAVVSGDHAPPTGPAGTLRISQPVDFNSTDPALAQNQLAWEMEYATCAKLVNYRGTALVPEVAAALPSVSADGLTYAFRLRRGFRFDTGERVTAASFRRAFERALAPEMASPAAPYLRAVAAFTGRGHVFRVRLSRPVPDFPARMALPYFCAVPPALPLDPAGVEEPPSAGPYYIASRDPGRQLVLERNPYYRGDRRRGADRIVYSVGAMPVAASLQVERGETDYAALPPGSFPALVTQGAAAGHGLRVIPQPFVAYLAMNTARSLFKGNPELRRAVNFALDRRQLVREFGVRGGTATDQYLPPQLPGYRDASIYPLAGADLRRARQLARGHTRSGKAILFTCGAADCRERAQIVQASLKEIGLDVSVRTAPGVSPLTRPGTIRGAYDIADVVWRPDYGDPYALLEKLLDGRAIRDTDTSNLSYFSSPSFNARLDRIAELSGPARFRAFGDLDADVARDAAPLAAYAVLNARVYLSNRVGCFAFNPVYGVDVAALCLRARAK
jgi:peptide/nickel transport system substrate-binding protein